MIQSSSRLNTKTKKNIKSKASIWAQFRTYFLVVFLGFLALGFIYTKRNRIIHYLGFKSYKVHFGLGKSNRTMAKRNKMVLENNEGKVFGIDLSQYQGTIDWDKVEAISGDYPITFVFIRATAGNDMKDSRYQENWDGAKEKEVIRGAYHYYRPNENSLQQAQLFIKTVQLEQGDLPPVLDIEKLSKEQSLKRLKIGLRRWLQAVEAHYKVKPIIYTSEKYYDDFLKYDFADYLFWIANYNSYRKKIDKSWLFWQYAEKGKVDGIKGNVDSNIFNGDLQQLKHITIE